MTSGIIFDIKRYAIHDGPGIRTTVFLKGCAASCWWCHNPESQSTDIVKALRYNHFDDLHFQELEVIGRRVTVGEVLAEIQRDHIFYDESGGGVTFSGGEPLLQAEFLKELLQACSRSGIQTTLDTTGYAPKEVFDSLLDLVDLFLYDIKFIDDRLHQKYAGVSNQDILHNLETLIRRKKSMRLRLPVIPGMTDSDRNIRDIAGFLRQLEPVGIIIDLLPYHKIARHKYDKLKLEYLMGDVDRPSDQRMHQIKSLLETYEFKVQIGG